jgi:hypothetical protein
MGITLSAESFTAAGFGAVMASTPSADRAPENARTITNVNQQMLKMDNLLQLKERKKKQWY